MIMFISYAGGLHEIKNCIINIAGIICGDELLHTYDTVLGLSIYYLNRFLKLSKSDFFVALSALKFSHFLNF